MATISSATAGIAALRIKRRSLNLSGNKHRLDSTLVEDEVTQSPGYFKQLRILINSKLFHEL